MVTKQLKPRLVPLPCPFCGRKPKFRPGNSEEEGDAWGQVYCANTHCDVQPFVEDGEAAADERGIGAYIDCAIRRWNKRHA